MPDLNAVLAVPDLLIPRLRPCSALTGPETECGVTPTSLYRKVCGVESHAVTVWLCPIHALLAACGMAICRDCADRGGFNIVSLLRLSEPFRLDAAAAAHSAPLRRDPEPGGVTSRRARSGPQNRSLGRED